MLRPTYMDGVKDAEDFYADCMALILLKRYVDNETKIVENDPRWNEWCSGVRDYYDHVIKNNLQPPKC